MFSLFWLPDFIKIRHIAILRPNLSKYNFGSRSAISNIIFMINKLDLLWVLNFIGLEIYFIFGTRFPWNEGIDTCFNVECVLRDRFSWCLLGSYCSLSSCYCWLLLVTWWLLLVTGGYCSLPLITPRSHF